MSEKIKVGDHIKISSKIDPVTWIMLIPLSIRPGNVGTVVKVEGIFTKVYSVQIRFKIVNIENEITIPFDRNDIIKITNEEYLSEVI